MKKYAFSVVLVLLIIVLCIPVFSHSGGTDSRGGHRDSSTGEYHYHHGYPAHQHQNGTCPYDYSDKTGISSGISSSSNNSDIGNSKPIDKTQADENGKTTIFGILKATFFTILLTVLLVIFLSIFIFFMKCTFESYDKRSGIIVNIFVIWQYVLIDIICAGCIIAFASVYKEIWNIF